MVTDWLRLLRPAHWFKNLFVLAPMLFAQQLFDGWTWLLALSAAGLFCLMSSAVYAFNDAIDAERDRANPLKAGRPVAAGRIRPRQALAVSAGLAGASLAGAVLVQPWLAVTCAGYLTLNALYSLLLKRLAFLDVMAIAAGFVLRVVGGALAIEVDISSWLVVCTYFLACLLGFGKRRQELAIMGGQTFRTRPALVGYSELSLRLAEWVAAGVTVLAYLAYTLAPGTAAKFGGHQLVFSLPFPIFGILRYLQLVESRRDLSPTEALVTDRPTLVNLVAWVAVVVIGLYDVL